MQVRVLTDTFAGRTVGSGWGTASDGNAWTQQRAGTNQVLSVSSSEGRDLPTGSGGTAERQTLGAVKPVDVEILLRWQAQDGTTGDNIGVFARWQDANNWYHYGFDTGPILELSKSVAGAFSTFQTVSISGTWVAATLYWFRVKVSGNRHQLRWWQDGISEPSTWNLDSTDSSFLTPGLCGISIRGNNTVTADLVDNFSVDELRSSPRPLPRVDATPYPFVQVRQGQPRALPTGGPVAKFTPLMVPQPNNYPSTWSVTFLQRLRTLPVGSPAAQFPALQRPRAGDYAPPLSIAFYQRLPITPAVVILPAVAFPAPQRWDAFYRSRYDSSFYQRLPKVVDAIVAVATGGGFIVRSWVPISPVLRWRHRAQELEELIAIGFSLGLSQAEIATLIASAEDGDLIA